MAGLFLYAVSGARLEINHNTNQKEPQITQITQILFRVGSGLFPGLDPQASMRPAKICSICEICVLFLF
jgi:hypothetical protein